MDINKLILCDLIESIDPTFVVSEILKNEDDFFYVHKENKSKPEEINALIFMDWALSDCFIIIIKDSYVIVDGISSAVEINLAEIDSLDRLKATIKLNMIEVTRFNNERSS